MITRVQTNLFSANKLLANTIEARRTWTPSQEFFNYPSSAIYAKICIALTRINPPDSPEVKTAIEFLKKSYDPDTNSWDSSPLATARALRAIKRIESLPEEQCTKATKFILEKARQDGTWEGELPDARDPKGESRYTTSDIMLNLEIIGALPENHLKRAGQKLMEFYITTSDADLISYHAAYTARPLYNLCMIGVVPTHEQPFHLHILRFLVELDTMRTGRKRADTVVETVHVLKLVLRTGLEWPQKKIEDSINWLLEVQRDGGWNRQAYSSPSPYITAMVVDVLCDYIAYRQFCAWQNKLLSDFVFPAGMKQKGKRDMLTSIWHALDLNPNFMGMGINLKKLIEGIRLRKLK